jgi:hypothetical protein
MPSRRPIARVGHTSGQPGGKALATVDGAMAKNLENSP